jgi:hypothetical protein
VGTLLVRHASLAVGLVFLLLGLATLADHGLTWDEGESYRAGAQDLRIVAALVAGRPLPAWPWHELPGYQFAGEALRAAFAAVVNRLLWGPGSYLGYHLFNLLAASVVVWLAGRLAAREGGAPVLGPLAALLLALHPKLIAHSQSNPKDGLGLLAWMLAVTAMARAARRGGWRDFVLMGVALGGALATHVSAALLVPLAAGWVVLAGLGDTAGRAGGAAIEGEEVRLGAPYGGVVVRLALALAVAGVTTLALWPWLWGAPLSRARFVLEHVGSFDVAMKVLYLGREWAPTELPWHYGIVSLAIATPLPLLLGAVLGLAVVFLRRGGIASLARAATLWLALVLLADLAAPARYDGARHLLPALPALALLAAAGVAWAAGLAGAHPRRSPLRPALVGSGLAATLLVHAWRLAAVHPYYDAFLALPARVWLGPEAQRRVELEYWGGSYKEGADWLLANAPAGSLVLVPMGAHAAAPYLTGRLTLVPHDSHPQDGRAKYLMLMSREAWYTPRVEAVVAAQEPVFAVRRQGSTLLAIYRVD